MQVRLVNSSLWGKKRAFKIQMNQSTAIGFYYGPQNPKFKVNGKLYYMDSGRNSIEDLVTCLEVMLPSNKGYKHLVIYTENTQEELEQLLRVIWDDYSQKFKTVIIYIKKKGEK